MLAVKVAVVALARTVTEAGNVSTLAIAPERETEAPPVSAGPVSVTVQMVLELEGRLYALHCIEETVKGATRENLTVIAAP